MPDQFLFYVQPSKEALAFGAGIHKRWATGTEIQEKALSYLRQLTQKVSAAAVPNAGKRGRGAQAQMRKEGLKKGMADLVLWWEPTHDFDRGVFFAEIKMYGEQISDDQIVVLNDLWTKGHKCGIYRHPVKLLDDLRTAGAPIPAFYL